MTLSNPRTFLNFFSGIAMLEIQPRHLVSLVYLPKVLVLQLERFQGLWKIRNHVTFPSQFSLKYLCAGHEEYQYYRICAVVFHQGQNIEEEHYIYFINIGEKWFECNDIAVQEVYCETVSFEELYLLFYVLL